jgi:hypothetical protein
MSLKSGAEGHGFNPTPTARSAAGTEPAGAGDQIAVAGAGTCGVDLEPDIRGSELVEPQHKLLDLG